MDLSPKKTETTEWMALKSDVPGALQRPLRTRKGWGGGGRTGAVRRVRDSMKWQMADGRAVWRVGSLGLGNQWRRREEAGGELPGPQWMVPGAEAGPAAQGKRQVWSEDVELDLGQPSV